MALAIFAAVCLAMLAGAVLLLLPAWLAGPAAGHAPEAARAAVGRAQLRELDDDVAAAALAPAARERAAGELVRRWIDDTPAGAEAEAGLQRSRRGAAAVAGAVVVASVALYLAAGRPEAVEPRTTRAAGGAHALDAASLAREVTALHARLQAAPDDAAGWQAIGRAYAALGRYRDASIAYARLAALRAPDAGTLADHADLAAMAQGRRYAGEPARLIAQALDRDPRHPKALALAASASMEAGDAGAARAYWARVQAAAPRGSALAAAAERALAALPPQADAGPAVGGAVHLAPALASRARPGDTLFVYARADDGSRLPLAIVRLDAQRWPVAFRLDDRASMAADRRLSSQARVVIGARLSRSGRATPAPGDLTGLAGPVDVGSDGVTVLLDRLEE